MRLIVGLGNPGNQYQFTPHNLGFLVIDRLAEIAGARVTRAEAMSLVGLGRLAGEPVLLAKPQTYMNASGMAVRVLLEKRNETPASLLVIADDVALPWGLIRLRERGGSGGHNGLESIIGAVGTEEFCRVRVGIKPDHAVEDLAEYVLTPMRQAELAIAAEAVDRVADAVTTVLKEGIERAMARFNRKVSPEKEEPAPPVAGPGEGDGESRRT